MQTIDLEELESASYCGIREIQLAHIQGYSHLQLQWLFRTDNIEVARALAKKLLTVPIIVMNGDLCVGIGFLLKIEPVSWKIVNYIP